MTLQFRRLGAWFLALSVLSFAVPAAAGDISGAGTPSGVATYGIFVFSGVPYADATALKTLREEVAKEMQKGTLRVYSERFAVLALRGGEVRDPVVRQTACVQLKSDYDLLPERTSLTRSESGVEGGQHRMNTGKWYAKLPEILRDRSKARFYMAFGCDEAEIVAPYPYAELFPRTRMTPEQSKEVTSFLSAEKVPSLQAADGGWRYFVTCETGAGADSHCTFRGTSSRLQGPPRTTTPLDKLSAKIVGPAADSFAQKMESAGVHAYRLGKSGHDLRDFWLMCPSESWCLTEQLE